MSNKFETIKPDHLQRLTDEIKAYVTKHNLPGKIDWSIAGTFSGPEEFAKSKRMVFNNTDNRKSYLDVFEDFHLKIKSNSAIQFLREDGAKHFATIGFPTTKNEEWKYTNVTQITKNNFRFTSPSEKFTLSKNDIKPFLICGKDTVVLVFENGRFNESLSSLNNIQKNVKVSSLAASLDNEIVVQHLGKYASNKNESFIALNTAFVFDGAFIHVPANTIVETPIHLLYLTDARVESTVSYPRNLIVAERNSQVRIAESYHNISSVNHHFTNSVTEVVIKENAKVEFDKFQNETNEAFHINHTETHQERNSTFDISTVTLGGGLVRNNLHIVLNDVNCTAQLHGLYLVNGTQLVDNHTLVDHAKPNCYSNELYKGIIDDKGHGVFNGKIFVRKDAQKTNAYQSNKNILLSDDATMNAKPQLEIFADDVKCSHGATTGQLDEEALFYLRSRGIGEENAKALLNIAFANDVLNHISVDPMREKIANLVFEKLKK